MSVPDDRPLADGGIGVSAYADAVGVYLACSVVSFAKTPGRR